MIGIDEVGRGAWAGPLLVCAVRLNQPVTGLNDSKLLSPKTRNLLSVKIIENANIGYGWISSSLLDDIGLSEALKLASAVAIEEISPKDGELIVIDGNVNFLPLLNVNTIPKADTKVASVSAASITAKLARDEFMQNLALKYPKYAFDRHVGYGTLAHKIAILEYGLCPEHRRSFKLPRN